MPRNEDGEFELILGNKQLLSLFFLVVVLFAVFFSLGYMVGKSLNPAPSLMAQTPAGGGSPVSAASAGQPEPAAREDKPAPVPEPPLPAVTETQPAREAPSPGAPEAAAPAAPPPAKPSRAASPAVIAREMHLQIAAVRVRQDAEMLVESLRKKGYTVVLHSQTRDGWYRVLVGPFNSERTALEMKALLEKDGYKSILKKP